MHIADFDYDLPPDLIAQEPARPRDSSRMLVLDRARGGIEHRDFRDLLSYLRRDDLLVLNDTRVIRARLHGRREPGGGKTEVLLLAEREPCVWEALVKPARRALPGRQLSFGGGELTAEVVARLPSGARLLRFHGADDPAGAFSRLGEIPLPPYVHSIVPDDDYQTVYARVPGASAAPTAGFHFTPEMMDAVRAQTAGVVSVTLHISLSTFRPVRAENIDDHDMHVESYAVPEPAARLISEAAVEGRRVVAVGTSTARALEAAADEQGRVRPGAGETALFIRPGFRFRAVGALLTNFHMPRSTLLLLVCAFAERDLVLRAYREAVQRQYRFLSFGDAMLIV